MNDAAAGAVDPYHAIAALYDLEHDPFRDDIDLLVSFAEATGGPILEMGCGSGRILAPLAEAGFTVTGVDRSTTMLDRARARLANASLDDRVALVEGDMSGDSPIPGGPFQMVVFSLNALVHLASPDLQLAALAHAGNHLAPQGQLVIDIVNPAPDYLMSLAAAPALEWSSALEDGSIVDKWAWRQVHPVEQVIDTTLWYDQVRPGGELVRHRTQFELRYVHPHELSLMLRAASFTEVRMYGSYELDPLDDSSERIIVTAGWTGS